MMVAEYQEGFSQFAICSKDLIYTRSESKYLPWYLSKDIFLEDYKSEISLQQTSPWPQMQNRPKKRWIMLNADSRSIMNIWNFIMSLTHY